MRRVRTDGSIKWGGDLVFISSPLAGSRPGDTTGRRSPMQDSWGDFGYAPLPLGEPEGS